VEWFHVAKDRVQWRALANTVMKGGGLSWLAEPQSASQKTLLHEALSRTSDIVCFTQRPLLSLLMLLFSGATQPTVSPYFLGKWIHSVTEYRTVGTECLKSCTLPTKSLILSDMWYTRNYQATFIRFLQNPSSQAWFFFGFKYPSAVRLRRYLSSGLLRRDNGGSKQLWNVSKLLPYCTAQQPKRQPSSYSPPWEPEISQVNLSFSRLYSVAPGKYWNRDLKQVTTASTFFPIHHS
jgi:hypothetical protein